MVLRVLFQMIKKSVNNALLREYIISNLLPLCRAKEIDLSKHFQDLLKYYIDLTSQNKQMLLFDLEFCVEICDKLSIDLKDALPIMDNLISLFYSNVVTGPFFLQILTKIVG